MTLYDGMRWNAIRRTIASYTLRAEMLEYQLRADESKKGQAMYKGSDAGEVQPKG
jgi:hypothetical protein